MGRRTPKTTGLEWLYHSMTAFNGSGYADKSSAEDYYSSYICYKAWRKDEQAVKLVRQYQIEAMTIAEKMLQANDAGRQPNQKSLDKFNNFKRSMAIML